MGIITRPFLKALLQTIPEAEMEIPLESWHWQRIGALEIAAVIIPSLQSEVKVIHQRFL